MTISDFQKLIGLRREISVSKPAPKEVSYPSDIPITRNAYVEASSGPMSRMDHLASLNLPQRLNNPGALEFANQPTARASGRFAEFPDYVSGRKALEADLALKISGKSKTKLTPNSTIRDFVHVYAPKNENDVRFYTRMLTANLGIKVDTKLSQLKDMVPKLADVVEVIEGYRKLGK